MKFIQGTDRKQPLLFPSCLDDSLDHDNETRLIDLFADSLDLNSYGFKTDFIDNGRPAYHPGDLLRLFIYGYLNRIRFPILGTGYPEHWKRKADGISSLSDSLKDLPSITTPSPIFVGISNGSWYSSRNYQFKQYKTKACKTCPLARQCTRSKNGKVLQRTEFAGHIEANAKRVAENQELYKRRQAIVEHPYGTIKRQWGYCYIMTKI